MFGKESVRAHKMKSAVVLKNLYRWICKTKIIVGASKCAAIVGFTAASSLQPVLADDSFDFALSFNAFIEGEFSAVSSDVQGKLAAGGNITLASYGVSSVYQAEPQEDVLISGGNIQYQNGQIFAGSVLAAGSTAGIGSEVLSAMPQGSHVLSNSDLPFSFYDEFQALQDFSNQLSELTPTGTTEYKWGGTHLTGDCESETQVFNIDGNSLLNSTSLVLNCTPETSTLLLNITGDHAGLKNIGLAHLSERATRTLYNFPEATSVELVWVGVEGTVLAPLAHFDNPRGSLNGTIIAKSWDGPMELHHVPFSGEFQGMLQRENQAPVYRSVPIAEALTESDYQYQIIVDDPDLDAVTIAMVTSPEGMTLEPETGLILWQPSVEQLGNHPVVISATDGEATVLQEFSIAVRYSNSAPSIEPLSDISMQEGDALEIPINATDREGDSLEYAASNLPNFATLENNVLKLQPGYDNSGYYADIQISVTDGVFNAVESFSLEVLDVNRAPQITSQPILSVLEGSLYTYPIVIEDPDANAVLSLALLQGPEGMNLDGDNNQLVWIPTAADIGDHEIKIEVTDELGLSDDQAFTLQVVNVNDAPILSDLSMDVNEDEVLQIVLESFDADGDTLSYALVSNPQNGTLNGEFPTISYTPRLNYYGEDHFTVMANDGIANSNIATVSITVLAINDAPTVSSDPILSVAENQLYQYQILGSDVDGDVLSYNAITVFPSGASLSSEGLLSWIPDFSQAGEYAISIEVSDGELGYIHSFDLTVQNVNQAPSIAVIPEQNIAEGEALTITIDAVDPDGDSLTYSVEGLPSFAVLNGNTITFSPGFDDAGEYENISVTVSDSHASVTRQFGIVVANTNRAPNFLSNPELDAIEGQPYVYSVTFQDPDGDSIDVQLISEDGKFSYDEVENLVVWDSPLAGVYALKLIATDTHGESAVQEFDVHVVPETPTVTTMGTDFWLMYNTKATNENDEEEFEALFVSSPESGIVEIVSEVLGIELSLPFLANQVLTVDLSQYITSDEYNALGVNPFGIHVRSDVPISLHLLNQAEASSDATLILPAKALGLHYIAMGYSTEYRWAETPGYGLANYIGIVATEDNTTVDIHPVDVIDDGRKPQSYVVEPFQISLNRGESYQLNSVGGPQGLALDVTGSQVFSDKPIAVFSGDKGAGVAENYGDHLVEQLPPVDSWSGEYYTFPLATRVGGDTFRISAAFDETLVQVDGVYVASLSRGEFYEYVQDQPSQILASKPVLVAQFSNGDVFDSELRDAEYSLLADPFMLIVPPSEQFLKRYTITTPSDMYALNYVNIVAPIEGVSTIEIDGVGIASPEDWSILPGEKFAGLHLSLDPGQHTITGEHEFGLYVYGFDIHESYGFVGGMSFRDHSVVSTLILDAELTNPEVGANNCVRAEISDEQGLPVSQTQVYFTRELSGVASTAVRLSDKYGRAKYCYRGSNVATEVVTAESDGVTDTLSISWMPSSAIENITPIFSSLPIMFATPGESYIYQVVAYDPNQDQILYTLDESPEGMAIDENTGEITWDTAVDLDRVKVIVNASDGIGIASQSYWLSHTPGSNRFPKIVSEAIKTVVAGRTYSYRLKVRDVDNNNAFDSSDIFLPRVSEDERTYEVVKGPSAMQFRPQPLFQTVQWETATSDIGIHDIELTVTDSHGGSDLQQYQLSVEENIAPIFGSSPIKTAVTGHDYFYYYSAEDGNGDDVSFSLTTAPESMVLVDSLQRYIRWKPSLNHVGNNLVVLTADDGFDGVTHQEFVIDVVQNQAPKFISEPSLKPVVNRNYRYFLEASDPEGDNISYSLVSGPAGMVYGDPALSWTPTADQIGVHTVVVQASDNAGGYTQQTFDLKVGENLAPEFVSEPLYGAVVGSEYAYNMLAIDPNGDTVSYRKISGPFAARVSGNTLAMEMHPSYIGEHDIVVEAYDPYGGKKQQGFTITVVGDLLTIVHAPEQEIAQEGVAYLFTVVAINPNNLPVLFQLQNAPVGMVINEETGQISWTPTVAQIGDYTPTIIARDESGQEDSETFQISAIANDNQPPKFITLPQYKAYVGQPYIYQVEAQDPEGSMLTYSLTSAIPGMEISEQGLITLTPEISQIGTHSIVIRATDSNRYAEQMYDLRVEEHEAPLVRFDALLQISEEIVAPNSDIQISVQTEGAVGDVAVEVSVNGTTLSLTDNVATYVPLEPGIYDVVAIFSDLGSEEVLVRQESFLVAHENDQTFPIVELISPESEFEIFKAVNIVATVEDENLAEYKVYLQRKGSDHPLVIAEGRDNVESQIIGNIDGTQLVNGFYDLILLATDTSGNKSQDNVSIQISGDLKIGNFSFKIIDVDVPASGVPVQVSRTYDTRRKHEPLDFGYGWEVDYQNIRIEESRTPGFGWSLNEYDYGLNNSQTLFCVEPLGAPVVTVVLPSGEQEEFEIAASPQCNGDVPMIDVALAFNAKGDTQSTLEAVQGESLRLVNGHLVDMQAPETPINPNLYTLTTRSGFVYHLNQDFGVTLVETPNGHTLRYTANGIIHSEGKSVLFERDSFGRISAIIDPKENRWIYRYDSLGDLVEVEDPTAALSHYEYNRSHGLVEMHDALERKIIKNLYDDEGRLYAQEDGDGNVRYFDHNLEANSSVVTDRDGRVTAYLYDEEGRVESETQYIDDASYDENIITTYTYDGNGNQQTKAIGDSFHIWTTLYDESNNLVYSEDPDNNIVEYLSYNARGQETEIKDELNRITKMYYDAVGNLYLLKMPPVIDPDTGEEKLLSAGNLLINGKPYKTTNLNGNITEYTYYPSDHESAGQKWTESNPASGTITYTYDANNNIDLETRERTVNGEVLLETVDYDYDSLNRLTKTTYPDGSFTETVYDPAGNLDKERDRFGVWTDYTYNVYGRLTDTLYADGSTEVRSYTPEGLLETVTDRSGHTTRYDYDDAGRQWKITYHDQSYTETRYTPQGWVQFEWDENRNLTEYEYDLAGKRTAVVRHYKDSEGNSQVQRHSYTYYANGELETETNALNRTTTYIINELDQRIETQYHNNTATQTRFNPMGSRIQSIDQRLVGTHYGYDDAGRLESVRPEVEINGEPIPATTYVYDEVGNKLSQTDANTHSTQWTYDYFGRVLTRTLPEGMTESFVYDDTARTQTHTDFNKQVAVTQFNNMGQIETVSYDNGTSESYSYWPNGQIHFATTKNGTSEYVYDNRDRLDYEIQPDGTRLDYDYDDAGNRTLVEITRDDTVVSSTSYTYDGLNRLETVTDSNGITRYTYDAVGNLDTIRYPNGIVEDYDYNTVDQLTLLTVRNGAGEVLGSYTYELDDTGRRESITEASGRFTDFKYDDLYRLTDEIITDNLAGNHTANYQYDWVGNRTYETVNGVETLYLYDDNDRLEQQGGTVYGYDDNGNLKTETLDGVTTTYHYDERNQLIQLEAAESTTEYTYNHNGIRTSKTQGGITTQYIVDANRDYAQVLLETGDTQDVFYTYGHDLISQLRANTPSFFIYDGLGSTRALSDSTGTITDTYDYEAFGELLNQTGATENDYLFTGEQFDRSLDQYYLRARYYDQEVGRFTAMDTWQGNNHDPITLHKYLYANVDPANGIDPSGNMTISFQLSSINFMGALSTIAYHSAGVGLAGSLLVLNGDSSRVDRQVTPADISIARVKAKTCVQNGNDDCELGIPTVIFGSDMWDATNHYWEAQTTMGLPQVLNRGTGFNRSWYTRLSVRECLGRGPNQQCDEYPFNSTTQGGPENYGFGRVSLKLVNGIHNGAAGTLLNSMFSECGVSAGAETDSAFAAIPVPGGQSRFFCPGQ